MSRNTLSFMAAIQDFNNARRKASLQEIQSRLTGRSSELLSYEEVAEKLKLNVRTERGVHMIPVSAIVGSVGRYTEFTRDFMPRKNEDRERWARVKTVMDDPLGLGLPPIDVYKVGEVYFVLDGNHRVSIARQESFDVIEAHVIEVKTEVPLTADIQPDDLIIKSEYAEFLAETGLARLHPGVDLSVSVPGQYGKLLEHIQVHRYYMGLDLQRDVPFEEAVCDWYDSVYMSLIEPARERGLCRYFPGRTETDLYLWVSEYKVALETETGWCITPEAAITELAARENPNGSLEDTGSFRTAKIFDRYIDRLFGEILVPITGTEEGWQALEQAILVARHENASLHGLHVIPPRLKLTPDSPEAVSIREQFTRRCEEAGLYASLAVEKGTIARRVCERALLTDLVVLNVAHPPQPGISSLNSGLRSIIWRCARPILTVSGSASQMERAMLAFDGSQKSREALFVATYLAEKWKTHLTVLTLGADGQSSAQDYAREYLELHEIEADFIQRAGSFDMFLQIMQERQIDLSIMGSYGSNAMKEVFFGSAVNYMLRESCCPLLICR